jgi:adenosylcobinamide-phosphate synthase
MEFMLQEIILIICFSVSLDYLLGEPPKSIHPVVWIGKIITFFAFRIKKRNNKENNAFYERICGFALALSLVTSIGTLSYLITIQSLYTLGTIAFILLSTFILKSMFSIKSMDKHIIEN